MRRYALISGPEVGGNVYVYVTPVPFMRRKIDRVAPVLQRTCTRVKIVPRFRVRLSCARTGGLNRTRG